MLGSDPRLAAFAALACRCESASAEQHRELLTEAWRTLHGNPVVLYARDEFGSEHPTFRQMVAAGAWESAALALRPRGWHVASWMESEAGGALCMLEKGEARVEGRGATLALALLAAVCRAEAQASAE